MSDELHTKLDKLTEKIDTISDHIVIIQVSQGRMEENVKEHMRRSKAAEENIALVRAELEPIKEHVTQVKTITKYTTWVISGVSALIAAIIAYFKN